MNALLLLTLLGAPDAAVTAQTLAHSSGQAYLDNRQAILRSPAPLKYAGITGLPQWKVDVLQQALELHRAEPNWALRTTRIDSLNPATYLRTRHRRPSAGKEVSTWPAALVMERLLFAAQPPVFEAGAYPARADVGAMRHREAQALLHALVHRAGRSGHAAAAPALQVILRDESQSVSTRCVAAEALGHTADAGAFATLQSLLQDKESPLSLREAAIAGLGSIGSAQSLVALAPYAKEPGTLSRAAIQALGKMARRRGGNPALQPEVVRLLVQRLRTDAEAETQVAEALSRVGDLQTVGHLEAIAEDDEQQPAVKKRARRVMHRLNRVLRRRAG